MQEGKLIKTTKFTIMAVSFLIISTLFLFAACNEEFNNSLVIKQRKLFSFLENSFLSSFVSYISYLC